MFTLLYIDPSAVTYTAQAIAAVVVAVGALITVFRHKIVSFFRKESGQSTRKDNNSFLILRTFYGL